MIENKQIFALIEALASSLELPIALQQAHPLLLELVSADYAALGVLTPDQASSFDWVTMGLPPAFFASYDEMAAHDFVRDAVARRPGVVLSDQQMIDRRALTRHPFYRRARDVGAPMERVMGVMLPGDAVPLGGLAVYRGRPTAFSDRERMRLQRLTRSLVNTVRNCTSHRQLLAAGLAGDALIESQHLATMIVAAPRRELSRSARTNDLLRKWFTVEERLGGLPQPLADALAAHATAAAMPGDTSRPWRRSLGNQVLTVSFLPIARHCPRRFLLRFDVSFAASWRQKLTPREREVLDLAYEGYDNHFIANELQCSVETVKKHMSKIFRHSGYEGRAMLVASKHSM